MKKKIKVLLTIVIVLGLAITGLYFGYNYNQSKKVGQVIALSTVASDNYWGDNIESYGVVTSEKSQTAYLPSGTEILEVNVTEGQHVNEGDVLLSIKKESKNINAKALDIAKLNQSIRVNQIKLDRLMKSTPAPDPTNVSANNETRDITYVSSVYYVATQDFDNGYGGTYKKGDKVSEENYDMYGNRTDAKYYLYDHHGSGDDAVTTSSTISKDEYKGKSITDTDYIEKKSDTSVYTYIRRTYYFDSASQKVVGETVFDQYGDIEFEKKVPTGLSLKQTEEEIENIQIELKKQDLELRKMQNEYDSLLNSTDNGEIKAKVSGTVSKVQNKDNYNNTQPFIIITATDEYYIQGEIGEFYLDQVKLGDKVTIQSWDTGQTTEATITYISDSPVQSSTGFYGGSGNTNSSIYNFKCNFDKNAGIEIGSSVSIQITPEVLGEKGLYIPSYLVRKDSGGSYVMKRNENNRLEKLYIKVGRTVWGNSIEVKSGLTMDDFLAFPYGNGAIEGINCEEVDSLYSDEGGY